MMQIFGGSVLKASRSVCIVKSVQRVSAISSIQCCLLWFY